MERGHGLGLSLRVARPTNHTTSGNDAAAGISKAGNRQSTIKRSTDCVLCVGLGLGLRIVRNEDQGDNQGDKPRSETDKPLRSV